MTTWLWIIGGIAVAWPMVLAFYLDHVFTKWLNLAGSRSENAHFADQRAEAFQGKLSKIHGVLEEHEALIVALWQKTFGFFWEDRSGRAERKARLAGIYTRALRPRQLRRQI